MIKTVKVKKQMRIGELLEYVRKNELRGRYFRVMNESRYIKITPGGVIYFDADFCFRPDDTFIVEVEEEITRSTIFDCLVRVGKDGVVERTHCSISGIKNENTIRIYALLDEELQLIWEAK